MDDELVVEGQLEPEACADCGGYGTVVASGVPGRFEVVVAHEEWCPANAEKE